MFQVATAVCTLSTLAGLAYWSEDLKVPLAANVVLSTAAFGVATLVLRDKSVHAMFIAAGQRGIDLNKRTTKRDASGALVRPIEGIPIPEAAGTVVATIFVLTLAIFIPFAFVGHTPIDESLGTEASLATFPHERLAHYLAALLTISLAAFMGFADDVLDLRWRHKLPIPFLAFLPMLMVYHASGGATGFTLPSALLDAVVPARWAPVGGMIAPFVELGIGFYAFLLLLAVFSTHAINIYAGVNGLEVGQSVVIALGVLLLNVMQLTRTSGDAVEEAHFAAYRAHHAQSLFLIVPFLATSFALLRANWWPAKVFVGDTYCYFAGMTFGAVSVLLCTVTFYANLAHSLTRSP
jgi:UDP-N-acetylglucosamine--dolichyl-phosphate N-acetylglucosaminephosphotransferase